MASESFGNSFHSFTPKTENKTMCSPLQLEPLRKMVRKYLDRHLYQSALFWADKVVSLSNENPQDVYWYAQCLFGTNQYHRAALYIKSRNLHQTDMDCRHLAAQCHFKAKEYNEALSILGVDVNDDNIASTPKENSLIRKKEDKTASAIALLKGQVYEAMENRSLAAEFFREALQHDIFCYDAFYALIQHQMLTKQEEMELLNSLSFSAEGMEEEAEVAKFLYITQLKKYDKPSEFTCPSQLSPLGNNLDIATVLAERSYYNCDYEKCYTIASSVLARDPFHTACLPIYISCLMELNRSNALFYLAHKLVDLYPETAVAWFAVGCYYLQINKTDAARRYLSKATALDRVFGPAWLMYGHSFAVENEHDQAMAAYCRASQLMKGCHLPLLYIGLEYGLSNNTKLAERFFNQALTIAPEDPFVLHELGVIAYQSRDYSSALEHFEDALKKIQLSEQTVMPEKWEPLLNNLGHTCRKLRRFEEALNYHEQALILVPQSASTFSAMGFAHTLVEHWSDAVEYFHKALGIQRDDLFSNNMLTTVIEQLVKEGTVCNDMPDKMPFKFSHDDSESADEATEMSDTQTRNTCSSFMDVEMDD